MAQRRAKDIEEKEEARRHKKAQPVYDQRKQAAEAEDSQARQVLARVTAEQASLAKNPQVQGSQRAETMLELQQSYGNRYVQRVVGGVQAEKGSGKSLEPETRSEMEIAFKQDFGDVRIHTGTAADKLARELGAKAFTTGKDIFFQEGTYQPSSEAGKGLLGHELTHVMQQASGIGGRSELIGQVDDALEEEAARAGWAVGEGRRVSVETASAAPILQRQAAAETEEAAAEDPKKEVKKAVGKITTGLKKEDIEELLRWAAKCQMLGFDAEAEKAIDEAAEKASTILKSKIATLDVKSAKEEMVRELLNAVADVMALGGDEKAVESALKKALDWAEAQLAPVVEKLRTALDRLKVTPTAAAAKEAEIAAKEVAIKAADVLLLGGEATEALDLLTQWLEESGKKEQKR